MQDLERKKRNESGMVIVVRSRVDVIVQLWFAHYFSPHHGTSQPGNGGLNPWCDVPPTGPNLSRYVGVYLWGLQAPDTEMARMAVETHPKLV